MDASQRTNSVRRGETNPFMKRTYLAGALLLGAGVVLAATLPRQERIYPFHYEDVLGTSLELKVLAPSEGQAEKAEAAVLEEIAREAKILSAWDASSEFSRWAATWNEPLHVSPELLEVLGMFDQWRDRTGGALDASAEAVVRVWKQAAAENRMPTQAELRAATALVKQKHWSLDLAAGTATHLDRTPIALNSFAKSYIMQHAAEAALAAGTSGVVVNIGGDIAIRGNWMEPVEVADPFNPAENAAPVARLTLQDHAIATSGNYKRGVEIGGRHYSHIIDPRTGETADSIVSSTVVSKDAAQAGALATAMSVLRPEESRTLVASLGGGIEYLIIDSKGAKYQSAGWNRIAAMPAKTAAAPMAEDAPMELVLDLEIKQPAGFAKRPYVAVWVEDKDKFPVRTMALWYDRDRWLPELRAWYHDDRLRAVAEGTQITSSVASATRGAGKYSVKWDGKDNAGKPVKPGKYTIFVEASREHGPYQILKGEIDTTAGAKTITLTGNTDIASANAEYRRAEKR